MTIRTLTLALVGVALVLDGCSYVTEEQGKKMVADIATLQKRSQTLDREAAELEKAAAAASQELKRLRQLVDESQVAMKSAADLGQSLEKIKVDLATITGRLDDLQSASQALSKNFTDYRAQSDIKLEQVVSATTNPKAPPIPDTADAVFMQAEQRFAEKNWNEARRLLDAFISRYPQDSRAPKAQSYIGESYLQENRYANAIGALTKLIDNYPKSDLVQDAMYKNGTAFYALKYCGDARIYFQELLRRYPRTKWKSAANDQLKKLARDIKNKSLCQS